MFGHAGSFGCDLSGIGGSARGPVQSVVGGLLFHVIDDEDGERAFLHLQLQSELLAHGVEQRDGAIGVGRFRDIAGPTITGGTT